MDAPAHVSAVSEPVSRFLAAPRKMLIGGE